MADNSDVLLYEELETQFRNFATKGNGTEATTKDITRWCKDAGVFKGSKTCTSQNLDIAFSVVKQKGRFTITFEQMMALIDRIAPQYAKDHKLPEDEAENTLHHMLAFTEKLGHGVTKPMTTVGAVDKLTDAHLYTGMHKVRFDEMGKGRGIDGREYRVENTGYVGQYKGEGTYDEHVEHESVPVTEVLSHSPDPVELDGRRSSLERPGSAVRRPQIGAGTPWQSMDQGHSSGVSHRVDPQQVTDRLAGTENSGYVHNYKGAGTYDERVRGKTSVGMRAVDSASTQRRSPEHVKVERRPSGATGHRQSVDGASGSKPPKVDPGAVTDRLTDSRQYTGMHKERFDSSGHGKGLSGRAYYVDGKGYVGNYQNDTRTGL